MNHALGKGPGVSDMSAELRNALRDAPPIVCFANDWRGDPTSKHHIMRTYARYTDVLWVESSGMRKPQLSKQSDLSRIAGRLRSAAGGLRQEGERLHVLSPISIPLPGNPVAQRANRHIYHLAISRALRQLGLRRDPLLWVYIPTVAPYLRGLRRRGLVYHCVDRWWAFSDYNADVMRACHASLCRTADVTFASAAALLDDCREYTPNAHLMRHGVEWRHFATAALEPPPRPSDIADIQGPILGFFGLFHEWVNQDLLLQLADTFPSATLILIGKADIDVSRLQQRSNIRLLGQKPYAELPAYAAAFDIGLIPFHDNELTQAVNPIKLREYLSAGMPVVATALPEIVAFADNPLVCAVRGTDEFIAAVGGLLDRKFSPDARRRAAMEMRGESWPGRCAEMAKFVMPHLTQP